MLQQPLYQIIASERESESGQQFTCLASAGKSPRETLNQLPELKTSPLQPAS
jgi:hypothetical protein